MRKGFAYKLQLSQYDAGMSPRRTAARQPIALQIADDLRIKIEAGELKAGDRLPTLHQLAEQYECSTVTARGAIALLKQQGLILGGRGQAARVRPMPRRIERSNLRHQLEKDLVRQPEEVRARKGLAEIDMGGEVDDFEIDASYSIVSADRGIADAFRLPEGTALLRREFTHRDRRTGALEAWSVSWMPCDLIKPNPAISDPANKAWPGGTMHQLYTVGIEIAEVIDQVTAEMPTTVEAQEWQLPEGVPLMWTRRISLDTEERVVEVSDAQYPADRTMLSFHTPLTRWDDAK